MDDPKIFDTRDDFVPPRHWVGVEELNPEYWNAPESREKRGQEFFEKPVEWVESMDRSGKGGMVRREFLTLMGASMAMATVGCARRPVNKIIPYVVQPEEIIPGVAQYYATTCAACSASCGVVAKNREGRPIKLEGNSEHPLNRGALCARGQASILSLYDRDRLRAPLVRDRKTTHRKEVAWDSAESAIQRKLKDLREQGKSVRLLTGVIGSPSTRRLISEFLKPFSNSAHVEYEALSPDEIWQAQELCYGARLVPVYRFADAEVVLSLGADFLGTWISPVEFAKDWVQRRKLDSSKPAEARMSRFFCFEAAFTVTGANADERYPIRPGDELRVALALAHELLIAGKKSVAPELLSPEVAKRIEAYTVQSVARDMGLPGLAEKLREIAAQLWAARGKSLVVAGSPHARTPDALGLQIAVNLLNSALGNDGKTVDDRAGVPVEGRRGYQEVSKLIEEMKAGAVEALIIQGVNPAYILPDDAGFVEALKKVPFVIVFATHDHETARMADHVLAESHPFESWGDAEPRPGIFSIQQPLLAPLFATKSFEEAILAWSTKSSWHDTLQGYWRDTLHARYSAHQPFEIFWEETLKKGVFLGQRPGRASDRGGERRFRGAALAELPAKLEPAPALSLALYANVALHDGSDANNPWLQELPHPLTAIAWDNYLSLSPELAKKFALAENDVVELSAGGAARVARLPVHVQPGLHPAVVAGALGYGRRSVGRIGDGAGVDLYPFARVAKGILSYAGLSVQLRKTGEVYPLASTQWHTVTEQRPILNDVTIAEYRKNPKSAKHTEPPLRMEPVPTIWPVHEYKGQRWGMTIDLNSCIGCGACVIACQAENNIPVVGRESVRKSRQMHWLRIDRYYSGPVSRPEVLFEPMLCQHCENAPCETVCPVIATLHNDEGLNLQVYNRCVGTRYCQNNCPYKVRRFNFFDHWKSYKETMNLAWNPDVTVRTRGVMEKCTFCRQRLRAARTSGAKAVLRDGEVQTACQQTCPTDAILFGDINDLKSRVSKFRSDARAFRILETQNTKPSISYLTKVRNNGGEELA